MDIDPIKIRFCSTIYLLLILVIGAIVPVSVSATKHEKTGMNVFIVVDSSKSMSTSDPNDLRKPAIKLLLAMLSPNDEASIVSFSGDGYLLSELTAMSSHENRENIFQAVNKLSSKGNFTNFYGALNTVRTTSQSASKKKSIVIFVTDGKMNLDPSKNTNTFTEKLEQETIPWFTDNNIPIHTIALSDTADVELLKTISNKTGGTNHVVDSAENLHLVFKQISDSSKSRFSISIVNNQFKIRPEYRNIRIYHEIDSTGPALTLVAPDGKRISRQDKLDETEWLQTPSFDVISFNEWDTGQWEIVNNSGDTQIYTDTQLVETPGLNTDIKPINTDKRPVNTAVVQQTPANPRPVIPENLSDNQNTESENITRYLNSKSVKSDILNAVNLFLLINAVFILALVVRHFFLRKFRNRKKRPAIKANFNKPVILDQLAKENSG